MTTSQVELIANDFSAAADHYHQHSRAQQAAQAHLFERMSARGRLLDLGAGPGTDFSAFKAVTQVVSLDVASGMLARQQQDFPAHSLVMADAQALPFQAATMETIYSNMALQWCSHFQQAIDEAARVLTTEGSLALSVVAENSLFELSELGFNVNSFSSFEQLVSCFDHSEWQLLEANCVPITVYFNDLRSLLYSIKGVGASTLLGEGQARTQPLQLRGRKDWQLLKQRAEQLRQARGLPLTYQIAFIRAQRK